MTSLHAIARTIFEQALVDCNIEQAMARHVQVQGAMLHLCGKVIEMGRIRNIRIIAAGKAASTMLSALLPRLRPFPDMDLAGVLIAPEIPATVPNGFQYFAGGHPSPNQASFDGARAALALLQASPNDASLDIFLISGGASAMMELPLDPDISISDAAAFHRALVGSGASIVEINCVRKHFSAVKGGRLAMAAGNAVCRSLLISDVPAGHKDALGSGPTLPDASTVAECREILARYRLLLQQFPASVRRFFESPSLPETPKPAELHASAYVLLDSNDLAEAARSRAEALGWTAVIDNTCDDWDYQAAAKYLLDRLRALRLQHSRICLISAGEVLVGLPADGKLSGTGGRNQQFALYAATLLRPEDGSVAILSAGSDGIDGNSPADGAVVDASMLASAPEIRKKALDALAAFNTHPFLVQHKAVIETGVTGNNLRDVRILLAED